MQKVSKNEFQKFHDLWGELKLSLASRFDLNFFDLNYEDFEGELFSTPTSLSFKSIHSVENERPMEFDFLSKISMFEKQFKQQGKQNQLLAKAIGYKNKPKRILDATCGKGSDTCFFSALGLEVISFERNPVLAFLLMINLELQKRSSDQSNLNKIVVIPGNATELLSKDVQELDLDVIYYDPMYPSTKSSALPKKEMRIFRGLVGEDTDTFESAQRLRGFGARLVVKRPPKSQPLLERPSHRFQGKSVTYDIY